MQTDSLIPFLALVTVWLGPFSARAQESRSTCHSTGKHIVVEVERPGSVGSDFIIRSSREGGCGVDSLAGDIVLRDEWAASFSGIRGDVLILDSGTGSDIRYLILIDMATGRRTAELDHVDAEDGPDPNILGLWVGSELEEPMPGCESPPGGFLPGVDSLYFVDVRSGEKRFAGRTRCAHRQ